MFLLKALTLFLLLAGSWAMGADLTPLIPYAWTIRYDGIALELSEPPCIEFGNLVRNPEGEAENFLQSECAQRTPLQLVAGAYLARFRALFGILPYGKVEPRWIALRRLENVWSDRGLNALRKVFEIQVTKSRERGTTPPALFVISRRDPAIVAAGILSISSPNSTYASEEDRDILFRTTFLKDNLLERLRLFLLRYLPTPPLDSQLSSQIAEYVAAYVGTGAMVEGDALFLIADQRFHFRNIVLFQQLTKSLAAFDGDARWSLEKADIFHRRLHAALSLLAKDKKLVGPAILTNLKKWIEVAHGESLLAPSRDLLAEFIGRYGFDFVDEDTFRKLLILQLRSPTGIRANAISLECGPSILMGSVERQLD